MFNKKNRAAEKMDRFQPEKLLLNSGRLQALTITQADMKLKWINSGPDKSFSIWYYIKNPYEGAANKKDRSLLAFVYDEETERMYCETTLLTKKDGTAIKSGVISNFENYFPGSTFQHCHLYLIYGDGPITIAQDSLSPAVGETDAQEVSMTAHAPLIYDDMTANGRPPVSLGPNDNAQPMPVPAPAPTGKDPAQASALRDEAMRLMEEAKRLEAEANMADGATEASA
jgi:hypothetical protein